MQSGLSKEIQRLGIADLADESKFIFGVDFGYYESPYAVKDRQGPVWMCADTEYYRPPVRKTDAEAERIWFEAPDQVLYKNSRQYPNKNYVTLVSKHGRKLCRMGCLWVFDRDIIDKPIYLTFGIGYRHYNADWFAVPVKPVVFDKEDLQPYKDKGGAKILASGIQIRVMPDELPHSGTEKVLREEVSITNDRPCIRSGTGCWKSYIYHITGLNGTDDRFYTTLLRSDSVYTDKPYPACYRRVLEPMPIAVAVSDKIVF